MATGIPECHFRNILIFHFLKAAAQADRKLCSLYGNERLNDCQCQNWFAQFDFGNFDRKDEPSPGGSATEQVAENSLEIKVDHNSFVPFA